MAKILVIDDYEPMREILTIFLSSGGHEVCTAIDGESGVRKAETTSFDLVLVDVDLPGLDGIDVCRVLKRNPAIRHVPVLLMTGRPGADVQVRSLSAGALKVLAKPFGGTTLLEEITRGIGRPVACELDRPGVGVGC